MTSAPLLLGATAAAMLATAAAAAPAADSCRVIRHLGDGRTLTGVGRPADFGVSTSASQSSASAATAGGGSSRSSVSMSSSTSNAGGGAAVASASRTDATGRIITVTRTKQGCTVVIDERHRGDPE